MAKRSELLTVELPRDPMGRQRWNPRFCLCWKEIADHFNRYIFNFSFKEMRMLNEKAAGNLEYPKTLKPEFSPNILFKHGDPDDRKMF